VGEISTASMEEWVMREQKSTKVVVCGAGGFIGGHLVSDLLAQGYTDIRAVDIKPLDEWYQRFRQAENVQFDLQLKDACYQSLEGAKVVYNLAADMGGMGFIENNRALCMLSVLINTHLCMAARAHGVERFFYASSACVYNADKQRDPNVTALKEEDAYPAMPEDGYGWEKLFSERMCRHFREDFGLEARVARFHNVYGPHGTYDGGREKAPAAICRKVISAKLSGNRNIEIWGDGHQTRSFMYIADCLKGIQEIAWSDILEPINLGSSELVSINQLVDIVEEIAGIKLKRSYNLNAPKGVNGRNSDNTLIRKLLGWEPDTRLRDGMEKTYRWIHDQMTSGSAIHAGSKR
jgi:GDP-D-mannose 3', 5'-epimerase